MEYCFHSCNTIAREGLTAVLKRFLPQGQMPVVVCIGSDLVAGDSLGPLTGTMLCRKAQQNRCFIYGTLHTPITAKEANYMPDFLQKTHPHIPVIAIDAAVGPREEIGLIKISNTPLMPGAGANKKLKPIGQISILGIVAEKTAFSITKLNYTRLNTIYHMAELITTGILQFLDYKQMFVFDTRSISNK